MVSNRYYYKHMFWLFFSIHHSIHIFVRLVNQRIHHHSIIASRKFTTRYFYEHCGLNTFENCIRDDLYKYIYSTHLTRCEPESMFYAGKMLFKYPNDYQIFGYQYEGDDVFGYHTDYYKKMKLWRSDNNKNSP